MPTTNLIKCGHCGHRHSSQCHHKDCTCDHPTTHPRPIPNTVELSALMTENNLTYRFIAEGMGISLSQVWRVLNGRANPSYSTLRGMAKVMDISTGTLVRLLGITWRKP